MVHLRMYMYIGIPVGFCWWACTSTWRDMLASHLCCITAGNGMVSCRSYQCIFAVDLNHPQIGNSVTHSVLWGLHIFFLLRTCSIIIHVHVCNFWYLWSIQKRANRKRPPYDMSPMTTSTKSQLIFFLSTFCSNFHYSLYLTFPLLIEPT